jgi:adenylate kinase family enzyme
MSKYDKSYYDNNKEKMIERAKLYYQNNKEKVLERSKVYYQENKDKINHYNQKYWAEHGQKYMDEKKLLQLSKNCRKYKINVDESKLSTYMSFN